MNLTKKFSHIHHLFLTPSFLPNGFKACEHRPPQKVVSELIRINPDSISEKNYGGDLPIHIACRDGASDEVIDVILNCDRYECSKVKDCEGRLPLHLAASNSNICVKTIQNLINVNERATRTPDDFQLLPLHWACSKNASPRIVETLLQAYPYAVEAKDAWERTPLDLAMMSNNPEKAQVVEMLSRNISSWTTGMISTVLTLSNKVLEAEKMEAKLKEQGKYIETFRSQYGKEQPLEALLLEIQYLEKKHTAEIRDMQEKSDEIIAQLRKEKDEAEKKMNNLKTLVDEVVSQLKKHQLMVEEKESERKKLKNSAVSLLNKIDEQNDEVNSLREENKKLKEQLEKIHS